MQIKLLFFDGCPHWTLAEERLRAAIAASGRSDLVIDLVQVDSPDEAERVRFRGSPTVLVDDHDPFASTEPFGFSCRLYRTDDGLEGSPSVAQLTRALRGHDTER